MVSIGDKFNAFGAAVQAKAAQAGNAVAKGARFTGSLFTSPDTQQKVEQGFRDKVNSAYSTVSGLANRGVQAMENEGVATLRAPIKGMSELNLRRLDIRQDMSSNSKALRNVANKMINYHENVVKASEKASRIAGDRTHAFVRLALTPIRFVAKILQIESAGALIQNSIALAAGFIVRGIVMTTMQLGHVLPYAVAGAIAGGIGLGIAALAIKVSPLAAFGVALALVLIAQQAQIITLGKKVDGLTNALRRQAQQQNQPSRLRLILNSALNTIAKNKGKVAAGVALGVLGTLGYFYGGDAAKYIASTNAYQASAKFATEQYNAASEKVAPYVTSGLNTASEGLNAAKEFVRPAIETTSKVVSPVVNEVAFRATQAANKLSSLVGAAKSTTFDESITTSRAFAGALVHNDGIASKAYAAVTA